MKKLVFIFLIVGVLFGCSKSNQVEPTNNNQSNGNGSSNNNQEPDPVYALDLTLSLDSTEFLDGSPPGTSIGTLNYVATKDGSPYDEGTVEFESENPLFSIDSEGQILLNEILDREDSEGNDVYENLAVEITATLKSPTGMQLASDEAYDIFAVIDIDDFTNKYGIVIETNGNQDVYYWAVGYGQGQSIIIIGTYHIALVSGIADQHPQLEVEEIPGLPDAYWILFDRDNNGIFYPISPLDITKIIAAMEEAENDGDTQNPVIKLANNLGGAAEICANLLVNSATEYEAVILSDGSTGLDMDDRNAGEIGASVEFEYIRNIGGEPGN